MNENNNYPISGQNSPTEQAPLSLMPALLARLGLDGSGPTSLSPTDLSGIRKALADPDWTVRAGVVEGLEGLSDWVSLDLLLSALNDEDEAVRAVAVRVLGRRGDPADRAVRERLEEALSDPAWHVRETAVYALGSLGAGVSIFALSDALHDSDDEVRRAAMQVIDRLQSDVRAENSQTALSVPAEASQVSQADVGAWSHWLPRVFARLVPHTHSASERELAMLDEKQETAGEQLPAEYEIVNIQAKGISARAPRPRRRWLRLLEQGLAAVLVLGIIFGWLAISRLPHTGSSTTAGFSETGATPLGAPTATYQGNVADLGTWSPDNRTFSILQIDAQKNILDVRVMDAATGHAAVYPVLDPSWIPALEQYDPFEIMQGRYLVAARAQSKSLATLEIWDIIGQRAVIAQIVPAYAPAGQVLAPFIFSSEDQQKFVTYTPDGKVTIWDVAAGQSITCKGTVPFYWPDIPRVKWYDHDQVFLLSNADNLDVHAHQSGPAEIGAWNVATGKRIISLSSNQTYGVPIISPDSKSLVLPIGSWQKTENVTTFHEEALEILDAHSGQVLRTYSLNAPNGTDMSFSWLPDSQHLLAVYMKGINANSPATLSVQAYTWDVFTGQKTIVTSMPNIGRNWVTQDGQYLVLGTFDDSFMQVWQTSTGRKVASIVTPGTRDDRYSFYATDNQYILIGTKDHFDIWDIATGKLLYKYKGPTPFTTPMQHGYNFSWSPNGKYVALIEWPTATTASLAIWRMP